MNFSRLVEIATSRKKYEEVQKSVFGDRPTSFPFVSGDTFASMADLVITADTDLQILSNQISPASKSLVFLEAEVASDDRKLDQILNWFSSKLLTPTFLIHNGDFPPTTRQLSLVNEIGSKVFCVNVIEETDSLFALPIGLENLHYANNGRLSDFLRYKSTNAQNLGNRQPKIFGAFNVNTNPQIRVPLAKKLDASKFASFDSNISRDAFRNELLSSMFVASPPGNGFDCHRTWEAVYLGAVPIVLKQSIAPSLVNGMPILAVETWDEVLDLNQEELAKLYIETISNPKDKAFMPYWIRRIK